MNLRRIVRTLIPLRHRQSIAQFRRKALDLAKGSKFERITSTIECQSPITIVQPIIKGSHYENKISNISRGAYLLNGMTLNPGQNWSFWHSLGKTDVTNGFVKGRNLVIGILVEQIGGGLCQLSSLIYHLAILSGLRVIERHPHSVDIYEEHERFTPLGADATIVWGYKDLRLRNEHAKPVCFYFGVESGNLKGEVRCEIDLDVRSVEFLRHSKEKDRILVKTLINGETFTETVYQQRQGMQVAR